MGFKDSLIFFITLAAVHNSHGQCVMEDTDWMLARPLQIFDTAEGAIFTRTTTGVISINQNLVLDPVLNKGPYFEVSLTPSTSSPGSATFSVSVTENFKNYEEHERVLSIGFPVVFQCDNSASESLGFFITIIDTNNNAPIFMPNDVYEFTVIPPLLPNFILTYSNQIVVRDIDLTTTGITFQIHGNEDFEISENGRANDREFFASLTVRNFLRAIPEPIEFQISATDIDRTDSSPLTTYATVRIKSNTEFELPEEPIFSRTFYLATYTSDQKVVLDETISLRQGYHEEVKFSLKDYNEFFEAIPNGNTVSIEVKKELSAELLRQHQILLVVQAERAYTSGATATVVLQLPEEVVPVLQFSSRNYVGSIADNKVDLDPIVLSKGYSSDVTFTLGGDLKAFFDPVNEGGQVEINLLKPIPEDQIPLNRIIILEIIASAPEATSAVATIVLEMQEEPTLPDPVFAQTFYTGALSTSGDLTFETPISLTQGFDQSIIFDLDKDGLQWFALKQSGENSYQLILRPDSPIPPEVIDNNQQLIFAATAKRPGGATAHATVVVQLVRDEVLERVLGFDRPNYAGSIVKDDVKLVDSITLSRGYSSDVKFILDGDLKAFFDPVNEGGQVKINLLKPIPEDQMPSNGIIILSIKASAPQATTAVATIVLELQVDPTPALPDPVFAQTFYTGALSTSGDLTFETPISLAQGFDQTIIFDLDKDGLQWFDLKQSGDNSYQLILRQDSPIPPEVIENNQQLIFVATAKRPGGATAHATVVVQLVRDEVFERVLGFDRPNYAGSIVKDDVKLVDSITLSRGYSSDVKFILDGDLKAFFDPVNEGGQVKINLLKPIPEDQMPSNGIIILSIKASAPQATTAVATIVLELQVDPTPALPDPVFAQTFYTGALSTSGDLTFETPISLAQGFDQTIIFDLDKDGLQWFDLKQSGDNSYQLILRQDSPIPPEVIENNQQLIFVATAKRPGGATAHATVVVQLVRDEVFERVLGFDRPNYAGSIVKDDVKLVDSITLSRGYSSDVKFILDGDLKAFFDPVNEGGQVKINLLKPIPEDQMPSNGIIILSIKASAPQATTAVATIVLEVQEEPTLPDPVFAQTFYTGALSTSGDLTFETPISLAQGFDQTIIFDLDTDGLQWFALKQSGENSYQLILRPDSPIPPEVIDNNQQLIFAATAKRPGGATAHATVVVQLLRDEVFERVLGFDRPNYAGSLVKDDVKLVESITLSRGYASDVKFILDGDLKAFFDPVDEGGQVKINLLKPIPEDQMPSNGIIILSIKASAPQATTAVATIVLEVQVDPTPTLPDPVFAQTFYTGALSTSGDLTFETPISLAQGFDQSIIFDLDTDGLQWFALKQSGENSYQLILRQDSPIPPEVIENNQQLIFLATAKRPGGATAHATVIVQLLRDEVFERVLGFDRPNYAGSIVKHDVKLEDSITLSRGYSSDVKFILDGDLKAFFDPVNEGGQVKINLLKSIPEDQMPTNGIIILAIIASAPQATSAVATIVLEVQRDTNPPSPTPGLPHPVFAEPFYFGTLLASDRLIINTKISLAKGYDSTVEFKLDREHSQWFKLTGSGNSMQLVLDETNPIPAAVLATSQQLIFVVQAIQPEGVTVEAAIIIQVSVESPEQPATSVLFDSASYTLQVDESQVGLVGSVRATADNGEAVMYSLVVNNEHLQTRISINLVGDLRLSAPVDTGVYEFQVVARAISSSVEGTATIYLTVTHDPAMQPLIVLNRDEEQPHRDLILLNPTEHKGCKYSLHSRWPVNQNWLYTDESGLHSKAIDREDPSIAFMTLSQVQVELTLTCDSDVTRTKRSLNERFGSYGSNTWLLGETIPYNRRKTIVNFIVNDINDNSPIFTEQDIIVGYPVPEVEQRVLPRSLVELQATDADVGENAALVYWSSEPQLAVSPATGFVHVRNGHQLTNDQVLFVSATDRNGSGRTGAIKLTVKLLETSHIAVVTIQNAFLEDENRIINEISAAVGYKVRSLRSVVMSADEEEEPSRKKREVGSTGASLLIYVYGIHQDNVVNVDRLKNDIDTSAVITDKIASILSLEDHLEGLIIRDSSGREAGLLAATIVLSVLLFILIVAIIVWYIITRKKLRDYEKFSDVNSLTSSKDSLSQSPKPLDSVAVAKPRLNIEELKRSEKRLQDMLSAPVEEVTIEPNSSATSAINSASKTPLPDHLPAIVIQDKLKDAQEESDEDEFGERKRPRKKSIVTFNENVEKIIHIDETPDRSDSNFEVFKF